MPHFVSLFFTRRTFLLQTIFNHKFVFNLEFLDEILNQCVDLNSYEPPRKTQTHLSFLLKPKHFQNNLFVVVVVFCILSVYR